VTLCGLHVLADDDARWKHDPIGVARAACAGGASVLQLRAKHSSDRRVLRLASSLRALTRSAGLLLFVNDRFDLALAAGADGVHLGQEDLAPTRIPPEARSRLLVGRSTHTLAQVRAARDERIDYMAFGPVFGTTSKDSAYDARGLEALREAAELARPLPLVAIGGVDEAGIPGLVSSGSAGFAVISAVAGADDPLLATRRLVSRFEAAS
jgi:thiamine-phosphate pyrophosphorylase